jgi:protein SCO1/2
MITPITALEVSTMKRTILLAFIALFAAIGGFLIWQIWNGGQTARAPQTSSGTALIGGPFSLTDHRGQPVTEAQLQGKYTLIYFGYSFCPDICPTELQVIGAALDQLQLQAPDKASKLQAFFITVDPERDTQAVLADYVPHFHPKLVGLTGSTEEIAAAARAYRIYYAKVDPEAGAPADYYFMDHANLIYLMGPDGGFLTHFSYGVDANALTHRLIAEIN